VKKTERKFVPKNSLSILVSFLTAHMASSCTPKVSSSDKDQVVAVQVAEDLSRPAVNFPTPPELPSVKKPTDNATPSNTELDAAAQITTVQIVNTSKILVIGDVLQIKVKFSSAVTWFGTPTLTISTADPLETLQLSVTEGIGSDVVTFSLKITEGKDTSLRKLASEITNGTLQKLDGGKVNLQLPDLSLSDTQLTRTQSNPISIDLPLNATFTDSFEFFVYFDTPVSLRGFPYIDVTANTLTPTGTARTRRAFATRAEANKVTFRYNVQQDDADTADGVEFAKQIAPANPENTLPAILGPNANPVKSDLSTLTWPLGRVIKVTPLLPNAALYAQFKAQSGDIFGAVASDSLSCSMTSATLWNGGEKVACWQPQDKSAPFLSQQGSTDLEKPTLVSFPQLPFRSPFIRFLPNGTTPGLGFPSSTSISLGLNSPRFLAISFHAQSEADDQALVWIDGNQGLFLNPTSSQIALKSGTKTGTTPFTFSTNKTLLLGLWDSGTETKIKVWRHTDSAVQDLTLSTLPLGPSSNVFNWPLNGLKLGGRKVAAGPAFEGGVNELLIYGTLTDAEQNKVMCKLATVHQGFTGVCP
jgi:hypothetical protein